MPIDPTLRLTRFARDESGAVAVITALILTMVMGLVAFGVDTASLYRDRAELQATADLTAMSALGAVTDTDDPIRQKTAASDRAASALARNSRAAPTLKAVIPGRYRRDPSLPAEARFAPSAEGDPRPANAVRVALADRSPLHFARVFTEKTEVDIAGRALAIRTGAASFSLDSALARLNGLALQEALSDRLGAQVDLSAADLAVLSETSLNLGTLLQTLRPPRAGQNPADVLNAIVSDSALLNAALATVPESAQGPLAALSAAPGQRDLQIASLVSGIDTDLGLTATDFLAEVNLSATDLLRGLLGSGPVEANPVLDAALAVPGVTDVTARVITAEPPAQSRWIALGERGTTLHKAATRIEAVARIAPESLGALGAEATIASIEAPLTVELAGATATLESLACGGVGPEDVLARFRTNGGGNGTSVATVYLGAFSAEDRAAGTLSPSGLQFADLLKVDIRVSLLGLPLRVTTVTLQARGVATAGASQTDEITFTRAEIARGETTKSFVSGDVTGSLAASLLAPGNLEIRIKPSERPGLGDAVNGILGAVIAALPAQLLGGLAAPLDTLLDGILEDAGIALGTGELTLTGHHCELIRLVQ